MSYSGQWSRPPNQFRPEDVRGRVGMNSAPFRSAGGPGGGLFGPPPSVPRVGGKGQPVRAVHIPGLTGSGPITTPATNNYHTQHSDNGIPHLRTGMGRPASVGRKGGSGSARGKSAGGLAKGRGSKGKGKGFFDPARGYGIDGRSDHRDPMRGGMYRPNSAYGKIQANKVMEKLSTKDWGAQLTTDDVPMTITAQIEAMEKAKREKQQTTGVDEHVEDVNYFGEDYEEESSPRPLSRANSESDLTRLREEREADAAEGIVPGKIVRIVNLVARADLNGRTGVVSSFTSETQERVIVKLHESSGGEDKVSVKVTNCELAPDAALIHGTPKDAFHLNALEEILRSAGMGTSGVDVDLGLGA